MSNPTLDPFLEVNACSNCPSGKSTCQENAGDVSFCTKSCTYEPLPECTGDSADRSGGLQKIIDDWMAGGATQTVVVAKYGSIEDWDVTDVKHFRYAFHATGNDGTFTADISKWDVSRVTIMSSSTFDSPLCFTVPLFLLSPPSFLALSLPNSFFFSPLLFSLSPFLSSFAF
jgi:surface protein